MTRAAASPSRLEDVRVVELPCHARSDGAVVVAEAAAEVPFAMARLFTLRAPQGAERGNHAHRLCSQFMICVHGVVDVAVDDGTTRRTFVLDRGDRALLVPPMIWTTVIFKEAQSVVAVLCDRPYEAADYLSDYGVFSRLRRGDSA